MAEQIVNRVKGRVPVVMHIGTATRSRPSSWQEHAGRLGVDAVGVVPPYYYPHDDWECTHTTKPSHDPFQACQCLFTTTRKLPGSN